MTKSIELSDRGMPTFVWRIKFQDGKVTHSCPTRAFAEHDIADNQHDPKYENAKIQFREESGEWVDHSLNPLIGYRQPVPDGWRFYLDTESYKIIKKAHNYDYPNSAIQVSFQTKAAFEQQYSSELYPQIILGLVCLDEKSIKRLGGFTLIDFETKKVLKQM